MTRIILDPLARKKLAGLFNSLIRQKNNPQWLNVTPFSLQKEKSYSKTWHDFEYDISHVNRAFPPLSSVFELCSHEFMEACGLYRRREETWILHLQAWDDFKTEFDLDMDLSTFQMLDKRFYLLRVGGGRKQDVSEYWVENFYQRRRNPRRGAERALGMDDLMANCSRLHDAQQECGRDCPARGLCWNNRFRRKKWKKVKDFDAGKVGRGLKSLETIQKSEFVIEFQGRVVQKSEPVEQGCGHHHYTMELDGDTFVDARYSKCKAKYLNHSCDPNCCVQVWDVSGIPRAGIFALQDIEAGQELTIDYRWQAVGKATTQCLCNSTNCRGTIELIAGSKNKRSKTK